MAQLITEPASNNPQTADWQNTLNKITIVCGSLSIMEITNKRDTSIPYVLSGSRIEINGSFFRSIRDEPIRGFEQCSNGIVYAYAIPLLSDGICNYEFNNAVPVYDPARGGYFHASYNWRAFLSARRIDTNTCRCKCLLDRADWYSAPDGDGSLIYTTTNAAYDITAGWYRIYGRGGAGGPGGYGGNSGKTWYTRAKESGRDYLSYDANLGSAGLDGSTPGTLDGAVWINKGRLTVLGGRNGNGGGSGWTGTDGTTLSNSNYQTVGVFAMGGNGGMGGQGYPGEHSYVFNNGKLVWAAPGGVGGMGGTGGLASYTNHDFVYSYKQQNSGNTGPIGNGYTTTRQEIKIYAL